VSGREHRLAFLKALTDLPSARNRLDEVCAELISAHRQLAQLLQAEHEGRVRTRFQSQQSTLGGKDNDAAFQTLDLARDIILLKGDIAAYTEERDQLRYFIDHADPGHVPHADS
jgi:hypothetical protein